MTRFLRMVVVGLLFVAPLPPLAAQQPRSDSLFTVERYLDYETVADPRISPDGSQILYTRRWVNKLEDKWETALWIMDADGSRNRFLTQGSSAVWSPDGTRIAYLAEGEPKGTQIGVRWMDAEGASMQITREMEAPANLRWAPDGSGVYFTADDRGTRNVLFASLRGGVRPVTRGTHMLSLGSVGRGGVAAGVRTSFHAPTDVVRIDLRRSGEVAQLTRVNDDLLEGIRLGAVEEIWYTSTGGTRVQGWIVKPPSFDPAGSYPLILEIHGGPHAMYNVGFSPMYQNFAAHGYVVLYTNPRGSTGYGTAFGNAIERAYPGVDYDDLIAGVDSVVGRGYIDTERMYVGGCSGGGVLTAWVIAHTERFAAASVRCPVTNWLSFVGQTDIPYFTLNFFERPFWEDPEPWLRQSPLMHVGRVKTPTLLMTGELDLRTPMAQTEEYYAALKLREVPTALLRFEGEFHGTGSKPSNWMRTQLYMMSWYERWGGQSAEQRVAEVPGSN